jgi:DNA-binding response OmpR family regulator
MAMQEFGKFPKNPEMLYLKHLCEFRPFRLNPQKRILLRDGESVALTPKGSEILLVVISNSRVHSEEDCELTTLTNVGFLRTAITVGTGL